MAHTHFLFLSPKMGQNQAIQKKGHPDDRGKNGQLKESPVETVQRHTIQRQRGKAVSTCARTFEK
jgi:hypothetical protein